MKGYMCDFMSDLKWKKIKRNREKMGDLLRKGRSYTDEKLVRLDRENLRLGSEIDKLSFCHREITTVSEMKAKAV